jgi:hypothetical protein
MGINDNPVESGLPNVLTNPYLPYVTSLIFLADIKWNNNAWNKVVPHTIIWDVQWKARRILVRIRPFKEMSFTFEELQWWMFQKMDEHGDSCHFTRSQELPKI